MYMVLQVGGNGNRLSYNYIKRNTTTLWTRTMIVPLISLHFLSNFFKYKNKIKIQRIILLTFKIKYSAILLNIQIKSLIFNWR